MLKHRGNARLIVLLLKRIINLRGVFRKEFSGILREFSSKLDFNQTDIALDQSVLPSKSASKSTISSIVLTRRRESGKLLVNTENTNFSPDFEVT